MFKRATRKADGPVVSLSAATRPPTSVAVVAPARAPVRVRVRHDMPMGAVLHRWDDEGRDTVWLNEAYRSLWAGAMLARGLDPRLLPR